MLIITSVKIGNHVNSGQKQVKSGLKSTFITRASDQVLLETSEVATRRSFPLCLASRAGDEAINTVLRFARMRKLKRALVASLTTELDKKRTFYIS